ELEAKGIVHRRALPPPAASSVYELTARGRQLEPVLGALGAWGAAEPAPDEGSLSAAAVLMFLRDSLRADPGAAAATLELQLGDRLWTLVAGNGAAEIDPGAPEAASAAIRTDPETLNALVLEPRGLDTALASGAAEADGDLEALRLMLESAARGGGSAARS
ncbi:MAG TPA: winged helix-turn-helix transcriptional regulator, partial [Solirubrobacteraceae bacterium]|nr:winged helix-turn-helix transcriptional regulator [Solirubrobacteraceae bacterium]